MAKQKNKKELLGIIIVLFIGLGFIVTILSLRNSTEKRSRASEFQDLNTADQIMQTNYADGTMGPSTSIQNFSNPLAPSQQGSITLLVTDPLASVAE